MHLELEYGVGKALWMIGYVPVFWVCHVPELIFVSHAR